MDTALPQKFPFILDRNLAKANCTGNRVCTSCDTVVLGIGTSLLAPPFAFLTLEVSEPGAPPGGNPRVDVGEDGAADLLDDVIAVDSWQAQARSGLNRTVGQHRVTGLCQNKNHLTLYALTGRIRPALPKFQFYNKKGSSKKFPMSVATMSR